MDKIKWRALLGLAAILVAVIFEIFWLWGAIIICWAIPDIRRGHTHLFEPVSRSENPITFWLINLTWIFCGLYLVIFWSQY
ncbi:MAG: hypothetical protein ACR2PT_02550 [Endozoicomonas sp.]